MLPSKSGFGWERRCSLVPTQERMSHLKWLHFHHLLLAFIVSERKGTTAVGLPCPSEPGLGG